MRLKRASLLQKTVRSHSTFYNDEFWSCVEDIFGGGSKRVLELACGSGLFGADLLERFRIRKLTMTDISRNMLRHARGAVSTAPPGVEVRFERLDFDAPEWTLADDSHDIAFIGLSFRNIKNPVRCLTNTRKVLNTDGVAVVFDFLRVPITEFARAWTAYVGAHELSDADQELLFDRYRNFCRYDTDDIHDILARSGFRATLCRRIGTPLPTYVAAYVASS